eukprot:GHVL01016566.1.p1 GENE.GHVL01016566.1~~GHVL01016566.1.p1  ORF type:complete len:493 (-),score=131.79 GHVL01016566.1:516-1964(-)
MSSLCCEDENIELYSEVNGASFFYFDAENIRKTSVCEVVNPDIRVDAALKQFGMGSLHDLRLGSPDGRANCATCGLSKDCPGHSGHIELSVVMYHPLHFTNILKFLKSVCWRCGRFRTSKSVTHSFTERFKLLRAGCVADAYNISTIEENAVGGSLRASEPLGGDDKPSGGGRLSSLISQGRKQRKSDIQESISSPEWCLPSATVFEAWDYLANEFFKSMPVGKCSNCGYPNVQIKKEIYHMLYAKCLSEKSKKIAKMARSKGVGGTSDETDIWLKKNLESGDPTAPVTAIEALRILQLLWEKEKPLLIYLVPGILGQRSGIFPRGPEYMFIQVLPVSSNVFRPIGMALEDAAEGGGSRRQASLLSRRTIAYKNVLVQNASLLQEIEHDVSPTNSTASPKGTKSVKKIKTEPPPPLEYNQRCLKLVENKRKLLWSIMHLQESINVLLDSSKSRYTKVTPPPPPPGGGPPPPQGTLVILMLYV